MNEWLDAEQRIERAWQLCESRRWDEALEQVDKALDINPQNGAWWSSRGLLLDYLGRYEEALQAHHTALAFEPDNVEMLCAMGLDCVRTGRMLQALETFEHLQKIDPDSEPAYCHRIMIYTELGDHEKAEEMFYLAQQIDEACPHCFWHLGCSMWLREDWKRAIFCWERVLEIEPRYRCARRRIAEAYRRLGEYELAKEHYLAEYREEPANLSLLLELGQMHLETGAVDEAIGKFRQALELNPQLARAWELLGDALGRSQRETESVQAYRTAGRLDDTLPVVNYKLAMRLMSAHRFGEARACLDAELTLRPADPATLMAAGNCSLELGRANEAQGYFEKLIAIDDCLPGAYHNLGVCHFLRNEYEEGIRKCQMALELKDDYALARHKLVLAHMHLGRWAQARRLLEESLAITPDEPALQELKRTWTTRRLTAWIDRLTGRIRGLVKATEIC